MFNYPPKVKALIAEEVFACWADLFFSDKDMKSMMIFVRDPRERSRWMDAEPVDFSPSDIALSKIKECASQ